MSTEPVQAEAKPKLHRSHLFRMVDGKKVPWIIAVDAHRVIVEDREDTGEDKTEKQRIEDNLLRSRGVLHDRDANGRIVLKHVPFREKVIMAFLLPGSQLPEGTPQEVVDLREDYLDEVEDAKASECTACDLNKIKARWREKLTAMIPLERV